MTMLKATQEQQEIINTFRSVRVLKVNSVAGSGKSSTLKMLAEDNKVPSLYIAFSRAIADEAKGKFPRHVECRTTHSLAYAEYGSTLQHKMKRPFGRYRNVASTPSEIEKYYGIGNYRAGEDEIKAIAVATLVKSTVKKFECSAEDRFTSKLLPVYELMALRKAHPDLDVKELGMVVLKYAKKLWLDRVNPTSDVLCTHDTYLKLWQLSKPVLNYDIIYVDEAQDSNPAVLDIIRRQTQSKICYVGDTHQSIFQFRGATNAMEVVDAPSIYLSKSFRYGQRIAEVANWLIGDSVEVKGFEEIDSVVKDDTNLPDKYTMLFRTNSKMFEVAVNLIQEGKDVSCEIEATNLIAQIESAEALFKNNFKAVKHEDITPFSFWADLRVASEDDPELKRLTRIVEAGQVRRYVDALKCVRKGTTGDIFLTTAHKSKGLEWETVVISDDFPIKPEKEENTNTQEINLFYVAVTRAIKTLYLPGTLYDAIVEEIDER